MNEAFGVQLKRLRLAGGWTRSELGALVGIDPTYVTRIESSQRRPPSRHLVEALAEVLPFAAPRERDRFYAAAGLLPPGGWDPALTMFRGLLARPELTPARRAAFLAAVGSAFSRVVRESQETTPTPALLHERVLIST